jgi:hypothetical protein
MKIYLKKFVSGKTPLIFALVCFALSPIAQAATITVNCPDPNLQSKMDNAAPGSTIIIIGTCTGNFTVSKNLTILGQQNGLGSPPTLDGTGFSGTVLTVPAGVNANVTSLVITNGSNGGIANSGTLTLTSSTVAKNSRPFHTAGGGIYNDMGGTLTLTKSTVIGNTADDAGGIFSLGTATLMSSSVSGNSATGDDAHGGTGGGISNGGTLLIKGSSTITGNSAATNPNNEGLGGGIANFGTMTLQDDSTVASNSASLQGGGIFNDDSFGPGTLTLKDSATVTGNTASEGGGIANMGTLTLQASSALTGNTADDGGGIFNLTGTITVQNNATVGGNSAGDEGGGIYNSAGAVTVRNSATVTGNTAANDGGGIFNSFGSISIRDSATVTVNLPDQVAP